MGLSHHGHANGLEELRHESTGLWIVFPFKPTAEPGTTVETTVETTVKTTERILEVLGSHPHRTLSEVAGLIGKSLRAVERAGAKLVKEGRLRYVGPRKGGHWELPR